MEAELKFAVLFWALNQMTKLILTKPVTHDDKFLTWILISNIYSNSDYWMPRMNCSVAPYFKQTNELTKHNIYFVVYYTFIRHDGRCRLIMNMFKRMQCICLLPICIISEQIYRYGYFATRLPYTLCFIL